MSERKTYCRACGENKGHNFPQCKNIAGLRGIIQSQDNELSSYADRIQRAEGGAEELAQLRATNQFLERTAESLLTLTEIYRQKEQR